MGNLFSKKQAASPTAKVEKCGGISELRAVKEEDLHIWNMYKAHLEKKIQEQFNVPKTHQLVPTQVAIQVVAGQNYFFKVQLPDKKYATARIYHIPWENETHGKQDQVAVHTKLHDNLTDAIEHF